MQRGRNGDAKAEQSAVPNLPLDLVNEPNGTEEGFKPTHEADPSSRPQILKEPEEDIVSHERSTDADSASILHSMKTCNFPSWTSSS